MKAAAANVLDAKHHPIIAIGGVSCYGQWEETCRYLQSKNIHFVADAFDSDRETNASVGVHDRQQRLRYAWRKVLC